MIIIIIVIYCVPNLRLLVLLDYLCGPDQNIYNIDFTRFKIRDMETATVLFEITKPPSAGKSLNHPPESIIKCIIEDV